MMIIIVWQNVSWFLDLCETESHIQIVSWGWGFEWDAVWLNTCDVWRLCMGSLLKWSHWMQYQIIKIEIFTNTFLSCRPFKTKVWNRIEKLVLPLSVGVSVTRNLIYITLDMLGKWICYGLQLLSTRGAIRRRGQQYHLNCCRWGGVELASDSFRVRVPFDGLRHLSTNLREKLDNSDVSSHVVVGREYFQVQNPESNDDISFNVINLWNNLQKQIRIITKSGTQQNKIKQGCLAS